MPESNPRVTVSKEGDVYVATLIDRKILDEMNISQIGEQLSNLVAASPEPKLLLDFTVVSHMSSSALGMLITLHKRVKDKKGQLRLCCIQQAIYEVFVITRLNEILKIFPTKAEALAGM